MNKQTILPEFTPSHNYYSREHKINVLEARLSEMRTEVIKIKDLEPIMNHAISTLTSPRSRECSNPACPSVLIPPGHKKASHFCEAFS